MSVRGLGASLALSVVVGASGALPASAQSASAAAPPADGYFRLFPKWAPFVDLDGKVGTKRDLGAINAFLPLWQNERSMLFGDVRFKADNQNSWEGNFGAGFRHMLDAGWNAGLYGFYDHRKSPNNNLFDQLTFGAELLGTNFDFRANTYWPIGTTTQTVGGPVSMGVPTATISGASLLVTTPAVMQSYESALQGFDAEAGARIPITPAESPYNLRFYAGGFRFDNPNGTSQVVAGPRLRLEFTDYQVPGVAGARFTVGTEWQTDDVRGSQFFAGLRLRIPLQGGPGPSLTMQERRMTDTIVRDVDIVAATQTQQIAPELTEPAVSAGGKAITALSSASTTGAALPGAVTAAGTNSVVVLQGSFTTTSSAAGIITLNSGQTVIGGGMLTLTTASGRTVTATLPGATVTGNVGTSNYTFVMATNSTLSGMTINNTDSTGNNALGVKASGVTGVTISNNVINATQTAAGTAHGIDITAGATATVSGNMITVKNTGGGGISLGIQVNTATATVSGNTISATRIGGGGTLAAVDLVGATINSGSTGNVNSAGGCATSGGATTGTVFFTDGTTCP